MNILKISLMTFMLCFSATGFSKDGIVGSGALFYFTEGTEVPSSTTGVESIKYTTEYTYLDLGFCYNMGVICLGAKYLDAKVKNDIKYVLTNGISTTGTFGSETAFGGVALKAGFSGQALIAHASYFINPTLTDTTLSGFASNTLTYNVTAATAVDIGYGFKLKGMRIGPMISAISFDVSGYTQEDGVEVDQKLTYNYTAPYFAIWIDF